MTALIEGLPGGAEWIVLLVVAVLLFGGSRLAGLGKGAGRAVREFKEETQSLRSADEVKGGAAKTTGATSATAATTPATTTPATTTPATTTPATTTQAAAPADESEPVVDAELAEESPRVSPRPTV